MTGSTWNNLRFSLPLPARTNDLYEPDGKGGLRKKGGARKLDAAVKQALWNVARPVTGGVRELLPGPVKVELTFLFDTIASDIDGRLKALFDCFKGVVWEDDRQVCELVLRKQLTENEEQRVHVMCFDVTALHPRIAEKLEVSRRRKATEQRKTRQLGLQPAVYR